MKANICKASDCRTLVTREINTVDELFALLDEFEVKFKYPDAEGEYYDVDSLLIQRYNGNLEVMIADDYLD